MAARSIAYHAHGTADSDKFCCYPWFVCHDKTLNQQCITRSGSPTMINHLTTLLCLDVPTIQFWHKVCQLHLCYRVCYGVLNYVYSCHSNCTSSILQRNAFSHPGRAIVKVMTMTTGELDYDEIFHQQEGEEELAFLPVSFILWIVFLVLIPVLLNNLLVSWYSLLISKVHKSKTVQLPYSFYTFHGDKLERNMLSSCLKLLM